MTKKILKDQGFYFKDIPARKLKKDAKVLRVNNLFRLKDRKKILNVLWQCILDQDIDSFKVILATHMEAINKTNLAKQAKLSNRTLHRITSSNGNPTLINVSKLINALFTV